MIDKKALRTAQGRLAIIIVALAVAFGAYRVLHATHLNSSALLFIGLPALLALIVALSPPAKSTTGTIFKVITLALLLSAVLFIEGTICILLAAPIFYLVGLVVGRAVDHSRAEERRRSVTLLIPLLLLMSLEGATPATSFDRHEEVTAARIVEGTPRQVFEELARRPRFDKELPLFLRLGFPRPGSTSGDGLSVGDRRAITFPTRNGSGTLEFTVAEASSSRVRFEVVGDSTVYRHWLVLKDAVVEWREVAEGRTRVSWTLRFERKLDPFWYFSPLERYGTRLAAGYLIDTLATPGER